MDKLDFFSSGVPPGLLFKSTLDDLRDMVNNSVDSGPLNRTAEVCLIGLASYFESYCKNEFASIINICPYILDKFVQRRQDINLSLSELLEFKLEIENNWGFILSEKFDFGSAHAINSLFHDLLLISPFSKDEKKKYDKFIADRNLLVHHGGTYTRSYGKQHLRVEIDKSKRIFYDSLVIKKKDYFEYASFIDKVARKINKTSHKAFSDYLAETDPKLAGVAWSALSMLDMYDME